MKINCIFIKENKRIIGKILLFILITIFQIEMSEMIFIKLY
jgi:hypothetical protein